MTKTLIVKSILNRHLTGCIILVLCGSLSNAFATSIDCSHVKTSSESIVCGDAKLLKLDTQLSEVYSKLTKSKKANKAHLQKTQKDWLLIRDKCADESCMINAYSDRVGNLSTQLHSLMAYKSDKTDMLALEELRQAVERNRLNDAEFPLEIALKAVEIKVGMTDFSNTSEANDQGNHDAHFPTNRPKGVSQDEWAALVKSEIDGGGENGHASYTLLDIDGDGKRDLIIDSYIGGTGLFNYISATPRKCDVFAGHYVSQLADDANYNTEQDSSLYSLNGRGANQSATWVRLKGRVYAAYRNSYYGSDHVFLLRPFYINESAPTLTIQYQYIFSAPKKQTNDQTTGKPKESTLDTKTYTVISKAIKLINPTQAVDGTSGTPICPPPANISDDERAEYFGFGPGHYSYEIVSDFSVHIDKVCHIGRVVNWFGSYDKANGLHAQLWLKLPNSDDAQEEYSIGAKRKAIKVKVGISKVDFGGF